MSEALKINPTTQVQLMVQKGPHQGQRFTFNQSVIKIGRSPENDIILINDPMISRQHAQIEISQGELEIRNLSEKNAIVINGENVQKWKLTHNSIFTLGDSEFLIQIESGQSVVAVKPTLKAVSSPTVPNATAQRKVSNSPTPTTGRSVSVRSSAAPVQPAPAGRVALKPAPAPSPQMVRSQPQFQTANAPPAKVPFISVKNPKFIFYLVLLIVVAAAVYFLTHQSEAKKSGGNKSVLKYSDESNLVLTKEMTPEKLEKREKIIEQRKSTESLYFKENFSKGMRDYQQGRYSTAYDYFQKANRLKPDHALTRNYLYLSKVRFDELIKAKMSLGDSYFQKNDYKMCSSLFRQVIDMLQAFPNDTNLNLAKAMQRKCADAVEGVF